MCSLPCVLFSRLLYPCARGSCFVVPGLLLRSVMLPQSRRLLHSLEHSPSAWVRFLYSGSNCIRSVCMRFDSFGQRAGLDVLPSKARYPISGLRDLSNPRSTDAALRSTLQGNQPPATERKTGLTCPDSTTHHALISRIDISH